MCVCVCVDVILRLRIDFPTPRISMQIKAAVFHYDPHCVRWELGLSTPDQRKAAWRFGHEGIILLDGTFNVSDKLLLLFIVMVIDDSWKGVRRVDGCDSCTGKRAYTEFNHTRI